MPLLDKLKTRAELREIVGARPRAKRVAMCAGVFDIVHPGHIRHLIYAKDKADILVAAVTADRHIDKGHYRPHVPEDLRAMNLAALEMVDYVLVDQDPTPMESIAALQPDVFAKGYEYQDAAAPRTQEEARAVAGYGGEMIFTPGDVVFSSSRLIDLAPPSLRYEKLLAVMGRESMTFQDLRATVLAMPSLRVHVVGDTIVDSYTHTAMLGSQAKTPTLSVLHERRIDHVGGAGVVAKHLRASGARVELSTVVGDDELGRFACDDLERAGVSCRAIVDGTRPTTNKNAFIACGYRLLKVDRVDNRSISDGIAARIAGDIEDSAGADAVIFSDFRHGIFNRRTIAGLAAAIRAPFKVADSQVASRWGNVTDFHGFDLIAPNEREARFALGDQDSGVRPLASALHSAARCGTLLLKLGERGVLACSGQDHEDLRSFFALDSFAERVADAVGAGDAMLAYATLAMLASGSMARAAILGTVAAALECELDGNLPVSPAEMLARIDAIERQAGYVS